MRNDIGIVYVATGDKYIEESKQSALSAKKAMPDVPIALWTDDELKVGRDIFDCINIIKKPKHSFFDKILPLLDTPYQKTLFVDTDTYFLGSIYEIFELLDFYDLAYAHAPARISLELENVPICFPEANTGVIAFRKNGRVENLIKEWGAIYEKQMEQKIDGLHDQPAFRQAIYGAEIRSTVLPPEYNFRTPYPAFKGRGCLVKILHGRGASLGRAIRLVNSFPGISVYDFRDKFIMAKVKKFLKKFLVK